MTDKIGPQGQGARDRQAHRGRVHEMDRPTGANTQALATDADAVADH